MHVLDTDIAKHRKPEYKIDPVFIERWSPRAMSGESISRDELMALFEAARWAPSCYNDQPWRFIYALRDTPAWPALFDLLVDFNKQWCQNAAALIVVASRKTFDHNGQPNNTHSFDSGSAWMSLALQGSFKGLVVHGMAGFDYGLAAKNLGIPEGFSVEAMVAVGRPGDPAALPADMRKRELPSPRRKVSEIAFEGRFKKG